MNFLDKSFAKAVSVFNGLRLDGSYWDAIIRVKDVEYKIHKIILCKCSPYFRALFQCQSTADSTVYEITGLTAETMQLIIDFAYSNSINVTEDNVQDLMVAADMLNVLAVVQACSDFLCQQLSGKNCIGIWQFTTVYFSSELHRKALRYITDHFEEVSTSEEFLQLSVEEVAEILGRDDLYVSTESSVFEAICNWIAHKPAEREKHIALLLSKFRMALTTLHYIFINVMSNTWVKDNSECQQMASDAIQTMQNMIRQRPPEPVLHNLARPRLPIAILLAIGGMSGEGIEAYDICVDQWVSVADKTQRQWAFHGTAFLDGYVYCLGGLDRQGLFNRVSRLDLSTHVWAELSPMHFGRCYVSVTVLNRSIYAIGGFDGHTRLKTVECYWPKTNQWNCVAPMHHSRSDASCTTLCNKIYICGGYDGNVVLQTAECYNPDVNQWTLIAPMLVRRAGIGVVGHADHLYVVGGSNGMQHLRSVEVYNPRTNSWHWAAAMHTHRSNFGLGVINDRIYVVGGLNGTYTTNKVEYYDSTADQWMEARDMKQKYGSLSCCAISGIPNMDQYAVPRDSLPFLDLEVKTSMSGDFPTDPDVP